MRHAPQGRPAPLGGGEEMSAEAAGSVMASLTPEQREVVAAYLVAALEYARLQGWGMWGEASDN